MSGIAFEHWIYIDREFLETSYENATGRGMPTEKTRSTEIGGGASVGVVSGSVVRAKGESFSVSKIKVTDSLYERLMGYHAFEDICGTEIENTIICTFSGVLYPTVVTNTRTKGKEVVNFEQYTELRIATNDYKYDLGLMPKEDNFLYGMGALLHSKPKEPEDLALQVRALLRLFPYKESEEEWAAIPLLIHEKT